MAPLDPLEAMQAKIIGDDATAVQAREIIATAYLDLLVKLKQNAAVRQEKRGPEMAKEVRPIIRDAARGERQAAVKRLDDALKEIGIAETTRNEITPYLSKMIVKAGPAK